ncbi:hypothetical protein [Legionella fallonii]|nr:hypothetical protein [Legionella fallonii]
MRQLFFTDFIRNRTTQLGLAVSLLGDLSLSKSIKHALILFGLPYLTSIMLAYHFKPAKYKVKVRISEQYRNK